MFYKKYKLDKFQEEAINSIELNHSVIVAAPTGAGKTLIAEYALEKHLQSGKQIVYTAPIKALSNQKYRDFCKDYGDKVGIITGDVVINDNAPVLIMTTEILRNIIFDDNDRLKDVHYVIFDEIHYIDDIERGTVWEECIIFAPQHIDFLCLSATIPNLREFASWMQSVRHSKIDMVIETHRPVPLEHKLYFRGYGGIGGLNELKELQKGFATLGLKKNKIHTDIEEHQLEVATQVMELNEYSVVPIDGVDLIDHIQINNQLPCLYFSFSRKICEENALKNIDRNFLDPDEREIILYEYDQLCEKYSIKDDSHALELRKLVENGVAYHHAGMLPTLKEVVERLFTFGYVKLLFTTETFALGINMPACSVVFGNLAKYDGVQFRFLKSREYHQMAGRAGRRGKDEKGFVYAHIDVEYDEYSEVKRVVSGDIEKIESQFNLSYSSILNLYEKYGDRIYDVCDKSLGNYQSVKVLRNINQSLEKYKSQKDGLENLSCIHDGDLKKLWEYRDLEKKLKEEQEAINQEKRTGHNNKRKRKKILKISKKTTKLLAMMKSNKCNKCENLKKCLQTTNKMVDYDEQVLELSQRKEFVENFQRNQIKNRLDLLQEIGYIDHKGLLPRGRIASQIYGYELQVTELFFDGYFHRLEPDWINIIVTAIVFESKRDCWYKMMEKSVISSVISDPILKIKRVIEIENSLGIEPKMKELDTKLSLAAYEWSNGCEFNELEKFTDAPPGDLVRYFRLASDLLRQIKRVVSTDDSLFHKINDCISRINRDVVDAERQLRAG
jgi:superfamily II RNA helicase